MAHLSLYDFRDLDLMLKVAAESDNNGKITTAELASALGMEDGNRAVAIRMAWMRRFGIFNLDDEKKMWSLTRGGERVIESKQRAAQLPVFDAIPDDQLVDVMAHVTNRYRQGDALHATLLRREFLLGTSPRSSAYGSRRR